MKIYVVMCGRQYEESWTVKAFKRKDVAEEYIQIVSDEQAKEDEAEGSDSGYVFFIRELEYEE